MNTPGFTAEASLRRPDEHYQRFGTPEHQAHATVSLAQLGFTPRPGGSPGGGIDLPSDWRDFGVAGATEVLCDTRCLREWHEISRSVCGGDGLCMEEMRPMGRMRCCGPHGVPSYPF
jgi:hypothetical protein